MNLSTDLAQLENAELIRHLVEAEPAFVFKHPLTQASAYDSLLHKDRVFLHTRVADALEVMYPTRLDEFAAMLAFHYGEANLDNKALEYATRAGDAAARVYANSEAVAFYSQALAAGKRIGATSARLISLYTKRGRVLEVMARNNEALETYEEMGEFARSRGDRALEIESLLLLGKLRSVPSAVYDRSLALSLIEQAKAEAYKLGDQSAEARALWNEMMIHLYSGESAAAVASGEQALMLARALEMPELLGFVLGDLGRAYFSESFEKVQPIQDEARAIWRALDNKPMLADNMMGSAGHALAAGAYDKSVEFSTEGIEISKAVGSQVSLMSNQSTLIMALLALGEFTKCLENADELMHKSLKSGLFFNAGLVYAEMAWVHHAIGTTNNAIEYAQKAEEFLKQPVPAFFHYWSSHMLARYYAAAGELEAARSALAISGIQDGDGVIWGWIGTIAYAEYVYAAGEFEKAVRFSAHWAERFNNMGRLQSYSDLLYVQGKSVRALGDQSEAIGLLKRASIVAERTNGRYLLWQIYGLLVELEQERGNRSEANEFRARARDVIGFIVEHTPDDLRANFLNRPAVLAIVSEQ